MYLRGHGVRCFVVIIAQLLSAVFMLNSSFHVMADERPALPPDLRMEWHRLANGRTEFEVSDPALVPRELALAIEKTGCAYGELIKERPVRFIATQSRRFAVVFCQAGTVHRSDRVFELSSRQPTLVQFPWLEYPDGFGTTSFPGLITWDRDAKLFKAENGTDTDLCKRLRYIYRLGYYQPSFVVMRVEYMIECGQKEWGTLWEATKWSFPPENK
jgi:hypothetical protein